MSNLKIVLYALIAVLVALLAGFLWGRAGRGAVQERLNGTELRLELSDARSQLLAARIDVFEVNFGRAAQHLQAAKSALQDAEKRLTAVDRSEEASRVKDLGSRVAKAQEQVGRLDQSANTSIATALGLLEQLTGSLPESRAGSQ